MANQLFTLKKLGAGKLSPTNGAKISAAPITPIHTANDLARMVKWLDFLVITLAIANAMPDVSANHSALFCGMGQ